MRIKTILIILTTALSLALSGCISYDYARRIVQQGNLLPQSKIERLKLGMSKNDVAILMGTSLLSPTFNNERWDYAYTWRRGAGPLIIKHLSLYFSNDRLARIEHKP
ncbi:small protein A [Legionella hackeliae]|uniref:Small protein A, tmRNA-binding n=2 Tax=Legionella hackeliae TaxID=449 RepID=A0A0A8UL89_LEGHA|nr:tmRNA-binding small protein A [Legionella hackeliae]CEK09498.1 Small protein A, tmRNA-binding [Legionella hackeliae]STX49405.1 small protein A [Legionella hackeliae]